MIHHHNTHSQRTAKNYAEINFRGIFRTKKIYFSFLSPV